MISSRGALTSPSRLIRQPKICTPTPPGKKPCLDNNVKTKYDNDERQDDIFNNKEFDDELMNFDVNKSLKQISMKSFQTDFFHSEDNGGKGNCLTLSFSQSKFGNQSQGSKLRKDIADKMIEMKAYFGKRTAGGEDGVIEHANTITRVDGKWLDQIDLTAYAFLEKRVVVVLDTSGNYDYMLFHPQDPDEEDDEIWKEVNRFTEPVYLARVRQSHYMLLTPRYFEKKVGAYFHAKVSERLYLTECTPEERQILEKEGAKWDKKMNKLYVRISQLWNPIFKRFGAGKQEDLQTTELERRTSDRSLDEGILELDDMDLDELTSKLTGTGNQDLPMSDIHTETNDKENDDMENDDVSKGNESFGNGSRHCEHCGIGPYQSQQAMNDHLAGCDYNIDNIDREDEDNAESMADLRARVDAIINQEGDPEDHTTTKKDDQSSELASKSPVRSDPIERENLKKVLRDSQLETHHEEREEYSDSEQESDSSIGTYNSSDGFLVGHHDDGSSSYVVDSDDEDNEDDEDLSSSEDIEIEKCSGKENLSSEVDSSADEPLEDQPTEAIAHRRPRRSCTTARKYTCDGSQSSVGDDSRMVDDYNTDEYNSSESELISLSEESMSSSEDDENDGEEDTDNIGTDQQNRSNVQNSNTRQTTIDECRPFSVSKD